MINRTLFGIILGSLFFSCALQTASAQPKKDELCFQVELIWGANEKQNDPKLTDVNPQLKERLQSIFKWNYYYKVNSDRVCVPVGDSKKHKLSDKCDIELKDLGKPMLEVKLYGEGKLMSTVKKAVAPNDLVLAGDDPKNKTAWFVVIKPAK
jgi:hypothetical protein